MRRVSPHFTSTQVVLPPYPPSRKRGTSCRNFATSVFFLCPESKKRLRRSRNRRSSWSGTCGDGSEPREPQILTVSMPPVYQGLPKSRPRIIFAGARHNTQAGRDPGRTRPTREETTPDEQRNEESREAQGPRLRQEILRPARRSDPHSSHAQGARAPRGRQGVQVLRAVHLEHRARARSPSVGQGRDALEVSRHPVR